MVTLFKALIRPVWVYGNVVWCPNLKKHVLLIEKVQVRFSKTIIGITNLGISAGKSGHDRDLYDLTWTLWFILYFLSFHITCAFWHNRSPLQTDQTIS